MYDDQPINIEQPVLSDSQNHPKPSAPRYESLVNLHSLWRKSYSNMAELYLPPTGIVHSDNASAPLIREESLVNLQKGLGISRDLKPLKHQEPSKQHKGNVKQLNDNLNNRRVNNIQTKQQNSLRSRKSSKRSPNRRTSRRSSKRRSSRKSPSRRSSRKSSRKSR